MEFSIGEAVLVDGLEGIYLMDGDVPERGYYRVKLSGLPVPSIEVPKSKVHKISTKAVEQIRAASDVGVENAEPDDEVRPVSPYTPEQILVGTAREAVIKPLYLGQITKEQAEQKLSIGRTVLNDLLRRYREWQSWEALVPGVSGRRKGDTRLEDEVEEILAKAIDEDYKGPGASVVAVLNRVRWECQAISKNPPSASTVERRCAQSSMRKAVANNQGPVAARDKFDSFPFGTVTQRALELGQADAPEFPNDILALKFIRGKATSYAAINDFTSPVAVKFHTTHDFLKSMLGDECYAWAQMAALPGNF
ncbi:integrase catalytic subunit [Pseudomonas syringae BRIP39023]|uniref:hypothetical protein n=1 Tax=Pseudomonas syringae TaxID=317 RepID=UPI0002A78933|nr:hypothetical protein [Pseudomonas syringae]ELQ10434.1 integrase catalytic subunit [Pseudomonas syringae BRIP39023]